MTEVGVDWHRFRRHREDLVVVRAAIAIDVHVLVDGGVGERDVGLEDRHQGLHHVLLVAGAPHVVLDGLGDVGDHGRVVLRSLRLRAVRLLVLELAVAARAGTVLGLDEALEVLLVLLLAMAELDVVKLAP